MVVDVVTGEIERVLRGGAPDDVVRVVATLSPERVVEALERLGPRRRASVFRVLPPKEASVVFERLDPALQREVLEGLDDERVARLFADLSPEDRVRLLERMPTPEAELLLGGLTPGERDSTTALLDYPRGSVGQWMNRRHPSDRSEATVEQALELVRQQTYEDAPGHTLVVPGRRRGRAGVGVFTVDDALHVLEDAETEDRAREGGSEPLRRPYLSTPVLRLVRSRVVWLLVLALSAVLTVRVLEAFEATLDQMVVLALFIPLLTGTGGNTGNQATTTVTRALALGDVRIRDMGRVLLREVRVGAALGLLLGALGFLVASAVYGAAIGQVIGSTLFVVCAMAATVGGAMPLISKALRVDPAVFSNPFISTFCDATGLITYFLIAKLVLHL